MIHTSRYAQYDADPLLLLTSKTLHLVYCTALEWLTNHIPITWQTPRTVERQDVFQI